ncbi:MAG: hypothetical protein QNJ87_09825 [Gammaproteobacteria bacterium]|nr:hypothetical protein [Gammaproteobacteria bacterium]
MTTIQSRPVGATSARCRVLHHHIHGAALLTASLLSCSVLALPEDPWEGGSGAR